MAGFKTRKRDKQVFLTDSGKEYHREDDYKPTKTQSLTFQQEKNIKGWTEFNHIHNYKMVTFKTSHAEDWNVVVGVNSHGEVHSLDINNSEFT